MRVARRQVKRIYRTGSRGQRVPKRRAPSGGGSGARAGRRYA